MKAMLAMTPDTKRLQATTGPRRVWGRRDPVGHRRPGQDEIADQHRRRVGTSQRTGLVLVEPRHRTVGDEQASRTPRTAPMVSEIMANRSASRDVVVRCRSVAARWSTTEHPDHRDQHQRPAMGRKIPVPVANAIT